MNPPREHVASGSGVRSGSSSAASGGGAGSFIGRKLKVPRPGSSRVPVSSSRRITVPNQVGKRQSLSGGRLERTRKHTSSYSSSGILEAYEPRGRNSEH